MNQKSLVKWLKAIIVGISVCGGIIYLYLIPYLGNQAARQYPEFSYCYWPWLLALWVSGVPCYLMLYFGWKVVTEIGRDHSFSKNNAGYLKYISILAALDSVYFFVVNLVFMLLGMNHPRIFLMSLFVIFAGVAIAVVTATLSYLVRKAADLEEENQLTI